jgi:hypothetical protein
VHHIKKGLIINKVFVLVDKIKPGCRMCALYISTVLYLSTALVRLWLLFCAFGTHKPDVCLCQTWYLMPDHWQNLSLIGLGWYKWSMFIMVVQIVFVSKRASIPNQLIGSLLLLTCKNGKSISFFLKLILNSPILTSL